MNTASKLLILALALASLAAMAGCVLIEPPPPRSHARDVVVDEALAQIERPYRYQGTDPTGYDDSGLVHYVFKRSGHVLPSDTASLRAQGTKVTDSEKLQGDLLFYRIDESPYAALHVGIYIGRDRMVHIRQNSRVQIELINVPYWQRRLVEVVRYLH